MPPGRTVSTLRQPLQKQLLTAWKKSIERDYCNQRINSERSLQASFWSQLNAILDPNTRRMFVEPRFALKVNGDTKQRFPDFVICNSVHIIAVVELKYLPRALPAFDKDMETLELLAKHRAELMVANSRFRGERRAAKEYPFSDSVLFVWAGVHRKPKVSYESIDVPMLSRGIKELGGCFLQLHAETDLGHPPKVFSRFR